MTVSTKLQPNNATQVGADYKGAIDATTHVHDRIGGAFACHQNDQGSPDAPDMTVRMDAGAIFANGTLTEVAAQSTSALSAPAGNPRKDIVYIDESSGAVGVAAGSEDASPSDPAIPDGKIPVCRVNWTVGMAEITNADLDDIRPPIIIVQAGGSETITAGEGLADRELIYQDIFNERASGATRWYKVDADAISPVRISPRVGITLAAITSGNTGAAQVRPGRVSGFSGLTAGQAVWAHPSTAAAVTQTAPAIPSAGSQVAVRRIGFAASATEIDFDPDPDTTFVRYDASIAAGSSATVKHFKDEAARERVARAYITTTGQAVIPGATGTVGGTMTANGGLAAAFNGTTSQTQGASAGIASIVSGTLGKTWLSAKTINRLTIYQPNNGVGILGATGTVTLNFYGGNGAVGSSGTLLYTTTFAAAASGILDVTSGINEGNAYTAHWAEISGDAGGNMYIAQMVLYESIAQRQEQVTVGSETINSAATDRVNTRFDGGGSPSDENTETTFVNRTGASRDLVSEVTV